MKKLILAIALFTGIYGMNAQNTLPDNGNVGIGTLNPTNQLHVVANNSARIVCESLNGLARIGVTNTDTSWDFRAAPNDSSKLHLFQQGSGNVMTFDDNRNVGIGTTNPSELLTVDGKILCEEVEVVLQAGPDYVFQKYYTGESVLKADYTMPTLEEVEAFTKANHHLPEVPSAATIKEEGLQLKEMTSLLLQKVEELTLYTIEQEKRINALEAKIAEKE